MPTPIREQVLQALQSRVGGVRSLEQFDIRDLPETFVIDGEDSAQETDFDEVNVSLPVTVARALKVNGTKADDWHTQGNEALGNLIKEVYVGGEDLGGLAEGIDYTGGSVEVITDGARGVMVQASFDVRFSFLHGDPFNQQ